jgi:HTH-type transcriptional regulator/antitoxin HigA
MGKMLDFTKPHLLRGEAEYEAAVEEIDRLLDLDPAQGSEDYERLEFLSVLVQVYEDKHMPREEASPQEVVDFVLEQHEMTRADLAELLGGRSRVSEFFSGKRPLSLGQARALQVRFGLSLDTLVGVPESGGAVGHV